MDQRQGDIGGKGPASLQHFWSTGTATALGQHPTGLRLISATSSIMAAASEALTPLPETYDTQE